jgi:hypothetical protein
MAEASQALVAYLPLSLRQWLWLWRRYLLAALPRRQRLWASAAEFDQGWKLRSARMARYIDRPGGVVDFGCGRMWLEQFLRPDSIYLPLDYIRRDARTIVVDLNAQRLPPLEAPIAVMSGVLEYVVDLDRLIRQMEQQPFTRIIASYNTRERVPSLVLRRALNWKSHAHLDELLLLFCRCFNLVAIEVFETNTIMVFDRKPV